MLGSCPLRTWRFLTGRSLRLPGRVVVLTMTDPNGDETAANHALIDGLANTPIAAGVRQVGLRAHPAAMVTNWRGADVAVIVRLSHRGEPVGAVERIDIKPWLRDAELVAGDMAELSPSAVLLGHLPRRLCSSRSKPATPRPVPASLDEAGPWESTEPSLRYWRWSSRSVLGLAPGVPGAATG